MTMKIDRMSNCERDRRVSGSRYILTCKECWSEFECEHKVALTVSVQFKVAAVLMSTWNATSTFNYAPTLESFQSKTNVTPESTSTSAATEREVERLRKKLFFFVCVKKDFSVLLFLSAVSFVYGRSLLNSCWLSTTTEWEQCIVSFWLSTLSEVFFTIFFWFYKAIFVPSGWHFNFFIIQMALMRRVFFLLRSLATHKSAQEELELFFYHSSHHVLHQLFCGLCGDSHFAIERTRWNEEENCFEFFCCFCSDDSSRKTLAMSCCWTSVTFFADFQMLLMNWMQSLWNLNLIRIKKFPCRWIYSLDGCDKVFFCYWMSSTFLDT